MNTIEGSDSTRFRGRSLLKVTDLSKEEFLAIVDFAAQLREKKRTGLERQRMTGRNIALIFEKASTRTRSAFEVAAHDQGGMSPTSDQRGPTSARGSR